MKRALVAGAGGFIGHHLVSYLKARGYWVRGVDIKAPEYEPTRADEFLLLDLRRWEACQAAVRGVDEVYQLAADMGGIGYITAKHAEVARNNVLIDAHMLEAAAAAGVSRYFYASSACVYPQYRQAVPEVTPLKEEDAHPAEPEEGYGWEKLYAEKLCQYYAEEGRLETRVARFHNIYGPLGAYQGGREKAPAALCRKIALARDGDEVEVWGDGQQTRSFTYIDDCVEGIYRIMQSGYRQPLNLGTEELVTIARMVDLIAEIAGKRIRKRFDPSKPQGVRGRNSDNTRLRQVLGWEPAIPLREGLARTYAWIEAELRRRGAAAAA
ncbi:MAG TPA: NAD-dependent epimerase/dehydratase family protein [Thermodesulfobacteriota bacterium]|nr:NAD-dependent epimerase/dehydratase family protein [Thermodesulfobacteriota bacterium]